MNVMLIKLEVRYHVRKMQKTKVSTSKTMEDKYDNKDHKHNKDHLDHRDHQKSHPHTQHGGDPSHNKHSVQTHSDPSSL